MLESQCTHGELKPYRKPIRTDLYTADVQVLSVPKLIINRRDANGRRLVTKKESKEENVNVNNRNLLLR